MSSIRHNPLPDYSIGPRKNQTLTVNADSSSDKSCHTSWSQLVSLSSTKQSRSSRQNLLRGLFEQGQLTPTQLSSQRPSRLQKTVIIFRLGLGGLLSGSSGVPLHSSENSIEDYAGTLERKFSGSRRLPYPE